MPQQAGRILIGCSGWQYKHWRGDFYPAGLPTSQWLEYYAARFPTTELNNSFYRLPEVSTFAGWGRRVPRDFVFAVKASRYLTHMKKLKEPQAPLTLFFSRARRLGRHLGPVLYQLPPRFPRNLERLDAFLEALPKRRRHAIEFRDTSWYTDDVLKSLERHRVALCLHDMPGSATGKVSTGPFRYVRLHGPDRYAGRYSSRTLGGWAEWCVAEQRRGYVVYVYFNNDIGGHAPRDAVRLQRLCASRLRAG